MHVGGTYTNTTADLRAFVQLLHEGAFGDLSWVQSMPLHEGPKAFSDLDSGHVSSSKVLLIP